VTFIFTAFGQSTVLSFIGKLSVSLVWPLSIVPVRPASARTFPEASSSTARRRTRWSTQSLFA